MSEPTPFPAINRTLSTLLAAVHEALEEEFVGLYLYGSLASGDFDHATSDVDFLVVTRDVLPISTIDKLSAAHQQLWQSADPWAAKLEGSYLACAALSRYDPADHTPWPTLNEGTFYGAAHGWDWVLQRAILREHGIIVAGPPIAPLIEPLGPGALREAIGALLAEWWEPMLDDSARLHRPDYQAYAILSMCRALHTLEHGTIATKPAAARWAQATLGPTYAPAIEQALAWRPGARLDQFPAAAALIQRAVRAAQKSQGPA